MAFNSVQMGLSIKHIPVLIYIRAWKKSAPLILNGKVFFQGVISDDGARRLQLRVPDSTWRQEMHYQREKLLQGYCRACKDLGLHDSLLPTECHIVA